VGGGICVVLYPKGRGAINFVPGTEGGGRLICTINVQKQVVLD